MEHLRPGGVNRRPSPQLPAFCRTRRRVTTTVRLSTLQQLLWLLLLVVFLQLSTILLILAGPVPAPLRSMAVPLVVPPNNPLTAAQLATPGAMTTAAIALRQGAHITTVPLSSQP
jgi:hypothetical protein